ncbi:prostate and testis expressed protein 1 isoform X1 [Artibeus jamaicensis]|uniref:prostate and testis expressed protein 1 isoform X1 n=1 Tax=Artibeus jamaicensis TaxID=9417 RepID=UPI00235AD55D|nr:prostate and testis expressed protein 1 isoform X1 [Artibeus jamaicensis]
MDKSLLLGLPILLCSFRVLSGSFLDKVQAHAIHHLSFDKQAFPEIVQCRMCHIQFPGDSCFKGRGVCTVTEEEACTTGKIFKNDGFLWLTFMGCLKNCANVNSIRWGVFMVNFRCCRSHDMCNESLDDVRLTEPPFVMYDGAAIS